MDKRLFKLVKGSSDFKQINKELNTGTKGQCYCFVNSDKFLRDAFLEVLLSSAYCIDDRDDKPCGHCNKCIQVQNNNNIDICYFGEETGQIKKEVIEQLLDASITKPFDSARKFLVVKNGDGLNEIDQNMLLKSLESLPEFDTVILMFSESSKILPTIKSRSRMFLIHSLGEGALVQLVGSSERSLNLVHCTDGNIGQALRFEKMKMFDECFEYANSLLFNFERSSDYVNYNIYLQKNKDNLEDILYIIKGVFYMALTDKIETIISKFKIAKFVELVSRLEVDLSKKQNRLMIIDRLLFGILKIRKGN